MIERVLVSDQASRKHMGDAGVWDGSLGIVYLEDATTPKAVGSFRNSEKSLMHSKGPCVCNAPPKISLSMVSEHADR